MNASHPLPGARIRRVRPARSPRRAPLEPRAARRFAVALACLGISYALAWIELPLGHIAPAPAESVGAVSTALAAALTARVLVGLLYALVALRYAWARWVAVLLGFGSVVLVGPLLPGEWSTYPLAALVTGLGLAGKLVAAVLLTLPLRTKIGARS